MKKVIFILILAQFSLFLNSQIIADHTVVDFYDDIPQRWIDSVKTKLVYIPGLSHGYAYFRGAELLGELDNTFEVFIWVNVDPPAQQNTALRLGRTIGGREQRWTSEAAVDAVCTTVITPQYNTGNPYDFIWFGWSYQGTWENGLGGTNDPVHNVRWAGSTMGGVDGNQRWGLDEGDIALTGNRVNMDTYLSSINRYNQYFIANGYDTKYFFSNGVVDDNAGTELGFQRELKNQYIRDYVQTYGDETTYFLDYCDILVYNASGEEYSAIWDDEGVSRPHQQIHPDNSMDYDEDFNIVSPGTDEVEDHIGEVGAVRLAKAMWWLLARASGWDGTPEGSDTTPPSVPLGLYISSVSESSVTISWSTSTDNFSVVGYNIFRDGAFLESTSGLAYTDNTISGCNDYSYTVSAFDAAGNESSQSVALVVNPCAPDVTPTITLSPNVANGVTIFELIVRVTELNSINTSGDIVVHIPKDQHWDLSEAYDPSLANLGGTSLNNGEWSYSEDADNHIFTSSTSILAGSYSTFGFRISFDPGSSTGMNPITSQLVSGGGGEVHVSNNSDSEQLDYFQQ